MRPRSGSSASSAAVELQPGPGHQVGLRDLVAVQLGQAVDGLGEQLRRLVRLVPVLVARLVEPEVGGQVDDLEAALAQRLDRRRRGLVRVGDQRGVGPVGHDVRVELLHRDAARGSARRPRRGGDRRRCGRSAS